VIARAVEAIAPASGAHASAARARVAAAGAPLLEALAAALGGAQHTDRPRAARRAILVCAGDHGADARARSGDRGAGHPTARAARAIARGEAALAHVARSCGHTPIVLVDAGTAAAPALPAAVIRLGAAPSADLLVGPALGAAAATAGLEAGIALALALAEPGLDLLVVGALGVGADLAAAAILAAAGAAGAAPPAPRPELAAATMAGARWAGAAPIDQLAALGGPDTAVLAGALLGAASLGVPVILDGYATGAAALVAASFAPAVVGSLIAAHAGVAPLPQILERLGLAPSFGIGLGHGDGTGAAMLLPLIDQVVAIAAADGLS
jgi:nicotinate-nucleotide--dimethylbenzimidazole phosphoribosyltransferase